MVLRSKRNFRRRSIKSIRNRVNKRNSKRGGRRGFSAGGSNNRSNGNNNSVNPKPQVPTFSAKLAAFILEGLGNEEPIIGHGDDKMQEQLKGALPYLHMNITQKQVENKFQDTECSRISGLTELCNDSDHNLDEKLAKVGFNCRAQSTAGVISINKAIIDSINNRWGIREHGQKHVRTLAKMMKEQVENGEIPESSIKWIDGLN